MSNTLMYFKTNYTYKICTIYCPNLSLSLALMDHAVICVCNNFFNVYGIFINIDVLCYIGKTFTYYYIILGLTTLGKKHL